MSRRIDLCVEKILARMVIDDDQRRRIELEIRDHLEELVAEARQRDLTEDEAEAEAIRQFGGSSLLARAFNLPGSRFWALLDIFTGSLCFALALSIVGPYPHRLHIFLAAWFYLTAALLHQKLWAKIEVNGGLLLRPRFQRSRHFDFSQLKRVARKRGHLFGIPAVVFEFEDGKVTLPASARGMRAASLAIETLCPGVIEPKLLERLRGLRSRLALETLTLRMTATVFWLIASGFFAVGFSLQWAGDGYPWPAAAGLIIGILTGIIQAIRLPNRARAACLNILAATLFFAFWVTLGAVVHGNMPLLRELTILSPLSLALGIVVTWWFGRRFTLVSLFVIVAGVFLVFGGKFGPDNLGGQTNLGSEHIPNLFFARLTGDRSAAWIDSDPSRDPFGDSLVVAGSGAKAMQIPLEEGLSGFIDPQPGKRLAVLTLLKGRDLKWTTLRQLRSDDRIESVTLPYQISPFAHTGSPWSPDGRYLYFYAAGPNDQAPASRLFDTSTGKVVELGGRELGIAVRWLDATRVKTCLTRFTDPLKHIKDTSIQVFETDLKTNHSYKIHEYGLNKDEHPRPLSGLHYAFVDTQLFDMDRGVRVPLPLSDFDLYQCYDWDPASERITYAANPTGRDGNRNLYRSVVVFHPKQGVVGRIDFARPQLVLSVKLSPDGKQVLVTRSCRGRMLTAYTATTTTEVWDLGTKSCRRLYTHGEIAGFFLKIAPAYSTRLTAPCWSPDSRELVYPAIWYDYSLGKPKIFTSFILARLNT